MLFRLTPNMTSRTPWLTLTPVTTSPNTKAATDIPFMYSTLWCNPMVPSARLSTALLATPGGIKNG